VVASFEPFGQLVNWSIGQFKKQNKVKHEKNK
jgi:hypothetical protein